MGRRSQLSGAAAQSCPCALEAQPAAGLLGGGARCKTAATASAAAAAPLTVATALWVEGMRAAVANQQLAFKLLAGGCSRGEAEARAAGRCDSGVMHPAKAALWQRDKRFWPMYQRFRGHREVTRHCQSHSRPLLPEGTPDLFQTEQRVRQGAAAAAHRSHRACHRPRWPTSCAFCLSASLAWRWVREAVDPSRGLRSLRWAYGTAAGAVERVCDI